MNAPQQDAEDNPLSWSNVIWVVAQHVAARDGTKAYQIRGEVVGDKLVYSECIGEEWKEIQAP